MTENDLVEKLAIQICDISNGKEWDATLAEEHKERHRKVVREEILPLIRSYANGLVAAAVSECAKHTPIARMLADGDVYIVCEECKFPVDEWAEHILAVTLESAAKELERIKNEEYHRGTDAAVCHPARCRDEMIWRKEIAEARFEEAEWWDTHSQGRAQRIAELKVAKEK